MIIEQPGFKDIIGFKKAYVLKPADVDGTYLKLLAALNVKDAETKAAETFYKDAVVVEPAAEAC